MYKTENHWTLEEALGLIRSLQPQTRPYGYHLCVGGGVIKKGTSKKDLDLFFLPLDNNRKGNPTGLMLWLVSMWGTCRDLKNGYATPEGSPYVYKAAFDYGGLRIDVFVISGLGSVEPERESKIFTQPDRLGLVPEGGRILGEPPRPYPRVNIAPAEDVPQGGIPGEIPLRRMYARTGTVPPPATPRLPTLEETARQLFYGPVNATAAQTNGDWVRQIFFTPTAGAVIDDIAVAPNTQGIQGNQGGQRNTGEGNG